MKKPSQRSIRIAIVALTVFAITLVVFARCTRLDFVKYDDYARVVNNPRLHYGITATSLKWALTTGHAGDFNPLAWISHMLDWSMFGNAPAGHHLTSVLAHALTAAFLFLLFCRMTDSLWPAAFAAALWALHPLRVESVAWISERKDVLCGMFWVMTAVAYLRYGRSRQEGRSGLSWYVLTLALGAAALLSKAMAVTLPFCLLLLDFWPLGRFAFNPWQAMPPNLEGARPRAPRRPRPAALQPGDDRMEDLSGKALNGERKTGILMLILEKLPIFAMAATVGVVAYIVTQGVGAIYPTEQLTLFMRTQNALVSYVRYLGKMFWPVDLVILYPYPEGSILPQAAGAGLFLLLISVLAVWLLKRAPWFAVGWFWYAGTLLPVSGIVQAGHHAMADRYTYVPQIGLYLIACPLAGMLYRRIACGRRAASAAVTLCAVAILGILSTLTWRQIAHWCNGTHLFSHALSCTQRNYLAHNALGASLDMNGDPVAAIDEYRKSIAINAGFASAYYNWGNALIHMGDLDAGIARFKDAERTRPDPFIYRNLTAALNMKGEYRAAEVYGKKALELDPESDAIQSNMGAVLFNLKRPAEAIPYFRAALKINPGSAQACHGLGSSLLQIGDAESAVRMYREALRLAPGMSSAYLNMAHALTTLGRPDEAEAALQNGLAIALKSGDGAMAQLFRQQLAPIARP